LSEAWNVSIGQGSTLDARLAAPPVVAGGTVYTIDTTATVRAFDAATGGQRWAVQFGTERGNNASLFGGGVAVEGDRVFATNGLGFVAALNTANGAQLWQVRPGGPLRGAPTLAGDTLYVMSQDNQLYSLKTADGATNWSATAAVEIAGVFGTAAPGVRARHGGGRLLVGELNAYRFENGRLVWQDALARTSISTSVATLSDIDASPVIDNGQVFALGQGGRMVALDLISGQRIWELNLAGIATPWIAGDWLFAVTDDAKVMAISRNNGKIRWINQLPAFENPKAKRGSDQLCRPGAGRRAADPGRRQWRAGQHRSRDRCLPEPDQRRRAGQPVAGGGRQHALRAGRSRAAARLSLGPAARRGSACARLALTEVLS
jgi:outer membrane protein assembly factor BamB